MSRRLTLTGVSQHGSESVRHFLSLLRPVSCVDFIPSFRCSEASFCCSFTTNSLPTVNTAFVQKHIPCRSVLHHVLYFCLPVVRSALQNLWNWKLQLALVPLSEILYGLVLRGGFTLD